MSIQVHHLDAKSLSSLHNEPDVEVYANKFLSGLGFSLRHRKTGNKDIDKCWPSKAAVGKSPGAPDILVYVHADDALPFCVWENKGPGEPISNALEEAKFYVEGLHLKKPAQPGLPRLAAGFNGRELRLQYFNHENKWLSVKAEGTEVVDAFPIRQYAGNGFASNGNFNAFRGHATAANLRNILPTLKNIYRGIPALSSGRRQIDFTVALLTLRMLCEMLPTWGTWAEQPSLSPGAIDTDHALKERFATLLGRINNDKSLNRKYGDIFAFSEKVVGANAEVAFSFEECLKNIEAGAGFYWQMYASLDTLPPLHGAEFDVFGEVYQAIGDDATKKALGEFFTGRHIISAVVPLLFERAGTNTFAQITDRTIADIACGTGGFLTETLRYVRRKFQLDEEGTKDFAEKAFYGYDLSQSNASRARVNMYFAGDGFSTIAGDVDSLAPGALPKQPAKGFDFILANPPYGKSPKYQRLEEAFLQRILGVLKPGEGWGLVVLPTGVLENPRSAQTRLNLLRSARITDVVALPPHAFAPYTKQRTAIVVFQKRAKALSALTWEDLTKQIGTEEVSMFIVDNDGYANSDKRYITNMAAKTGEWLHNDLEAWIHMHTGDAHESRLLKALLRKIAPKAATDEYGTVVGKKYGVFTVKELSKQSSQLDSEAGRGISLLPDQFLRPVGASVSLSQFKQLCDDLSATASGTEPAPELAGPFSDVLRKALMTPVKIAKSESVLYRVADAFDAKKGDAALTEAVMYAQQDAKGLPVYGGGESLPRFKIAKTSKTKKGGFITVHKGPVLLVAMDGSSGAVRVIESGEFVANHHGSILSPKATFKHDLYAVAQQLEWGLRALASNKEGSATLTLPALNSFTFSLPSDAAAEAEIGKCRRTLAKMRDRFL
ncbi:HsdM family class I SAM-dependent methyltransferase [Paraburkholderia graminis]|uniref:HsdM family class I SAM-dependent methyltransferase n=1 Tax=Paraburkholderia graminis TaxID=60548 RepID=UPI00040788FD